MEEIKRQITKWTVSQDLIQSPCLTDTLSMQPQSGIPTLKMRSAPLRKSHAERQGGSQTVTAEHRASSPLWTLWNGQLFNNDAGKPNWRCFSSSNMTSAPSARAVCQDQQAADVARGRTTTTAMTSLPAGHSTIGRCRSSRELDQTGTVCLRRSWRLTPWTAWSPGSTPTKNSDPPSKLLPSPSVSPSLNHRNYLYLHHLFSLW